MLSTVARDSVFSLLGLKTEFPPGQCEHFASCVLQTRRIILQASAALFVTEYSDVNIRSLEAAFPASWTARWTEIILYAQIKND